MGSIGIARSFAPELGFFGLLVVGVDGGVMTALAISFCSLVVSFVSFVFSIRHLRRSFRPIVSVMVKTHDSGDAAIFYDLVLLNSGTLPARNIRITAEAGSLNAALGRDASDENKRRWLGAFDRVIYLLHNGDKMSCSFGTTRANDGGFWRYDATISITVRYEHWFGTGWFGRPFNEDQKIRIADSDSFTDYHWGDTN